MRQPQCLVFGPFRLDLRDERLWRGQEVVRVLPKPFTVDAVQGSLRFPVALGRHRLA
jgi:hypothetical protein